ncbi:hypothetical protein BH24ACT5_BH24ACT5_22630 [soil metagenome]
MPGGATAKRAAASGGAVSNVGCLVSVNDLTIRAALIAGLAIFALVMTGWRKTARATPKSSRGVGGSQGAGPIAVERHATDSYTPPTPLRRFGAIIASGGLSVVIAVVLATVKAFGIAVVVKTMKRLLKK